jgi:hypothetical protein
MRIFVNEDLNDLFKNELKDLDFFINLINVDDSEAERIYYLFQTMKYLPASIRKFHGFYIGGLHDHVMIVTNIAYQNYHNLNCKAVKETNLIKAAMYHDLGKIDLYATKKKWATDFKYHSEPKDLGMARFCIQKDFKVKGKDNHVERCFTVMKNAKLSVNPEVEKAITFHHGGWSLYFPKKSCPISAILHAADMIAAKYLNV